MTEPLRVVVVDDSRFQCKALRALLEGRFGRQVAVETFDDPERAVEEVDPGVDLLLLDWEMPGMDGRQVLEEVSRRGLPRRRIIISSSRPATVLHEVFDCTGCLAVIEKGEREQQSAFLMILDGLMQRHQRGHA